MNDPKTLAAALVLELRSPLARVELAVSQLAREANTPVARELVATISAAVAQADRDIDRIIALLVPLSPAPRRCDDLRPVLARLRQRIAPVLEARGTICETRDLDGEPLRGDPVLVERAALALIRAGAALVGAGGRVSLGLAREGSRFGVVLECLAAAGQDLHGDPERAFAGLLPMVASRGGALENATAGTRWQTTLWFPGDGACLAS
ncbi:MAG: hypothetical protein ACE5FL_08190 [Myxococcota bacterium]